MANRRVTVFGGSGFLGRQIVRRLAAEGAAVRVAVRHPERAAFAADPDAAEPVAAVRADVADEAEVASALAGSDAAVNAVGHYVERGRATFEAIHGAGAQHVARAAAEAGLGRLVHISGIGADPRSRSRYVRARAEGERLVEEAFPAVTILRPSVMYGPEDAFLNQLAAVARVMPVLPLFGTGAVRLQPVHVDDVAQAVGRALATTAAQGKVYELGGPRTYSYKALLRLVLEHSGRRRLLLPLPYFAWQLVATLLAALPDPPISRDQVVLMRYDNVVDPAARSFADLGIEPRALEEVLPEVLGRAPGADEG
jgi:NADH dehydrogenase